MPLNEGGFDLTVEQAEALRERQERQDDDRCYGAFDETWRDPTGIDHRVWALEGWAACWHYLRRKGVLPPPWKDF